MNKTTLAKLRQAAPAIEKYRQLDDSERQWIAPIIDLTVLTAMDILNAIENQALTFEEISQITTYHPCSISQILHALEEHIFIDFRGEKAYAPTGRKRKLIRR